MSCPTDCPYINLLGLVGILRALNNSMVKGVACIIVLRNEFSSAAGYMETRQFSVNFSSILIKWYNLWMYTVFHVFIL